MSRLNTESSEYFEQYEIKPPQNLSTKLFAKSTPYSSVSATLSEFIASKPLVINEIPSSAQSLISPKQSMFFSPVSTQSSQKQDQARFRSPEQSTKSKIIQQQQEQSQQLLQKSEASQLKQYNVYNSPESYQTMDSAGKKSARQLLSEEKLQNFHKNTFEFLMMMNNNAADLKQAEVNRKIRKEYNLHTIPVKTISLSASTPVTSSQSSIRTSPVASIYSEHLSPQRISVSSIITATFNRSMANSNSLPRRVLSKNSLLSPQSK